MLSIGVQPGDVPKSRGMSPIIFPVPTYDGKYQQLHAW